MSPEKKSELKQVFFYLHRFLPMATHQPVPVLLSGGTKSFCTAADNLLSNTSMLMNYPVSRETVVLCCCNKLSLTITEEIKP